ncbi:hypothetical protein KAFR_0G01500 [Kazachstania africana CBS 2517]|uniref:Uncharacterized protein n=1 Tax=Kazachstania africana (strain ATCC 22294 / BCRC 22015 / CBS 2517 / CECT 1963 / NBRC 1671 / NRRL Y-8276) TaxID=1071382 RepID=H2AXT4_KAZAF|nr:hypothetical protein KAFR_0G01500 [Kazachstania africana CBS 2517]CCF59184.1 hypothetical protein KAFR_0G01500 [Kazachstania africana CBS 2517]
MFNKQNTIASLLTLSLAEIASAFPQAPEYAHSHLGKRDASTTATATATSTGGATCAFPSHEGMVAVQTSGSNAGWAMHSDQACTAGQWCPYACEPGQLMGQWDPEATSYTYPESQYGGLYCNSDGSLTTPNSGNSYCYDGKGTVSAVNSASGGDIAFCQTVLPGNEEMLIPTLVGSSSEQTLAVPGTDYWASTAAHYYINPPGVSVSDGCKWGDSSEPYGNWSPYVAGANMDDNGNTYVKIGWNPIYVDTFGSTKPTFGVKITCDDESKCNGLQCSIDPSVQNVNEVSSPDGSSGAGGATFCVVTAEDYASAKIEVFDAGNSNSTSTVQKREIHVGSAEPTTSSANATSETTTQEHTHTTTTTQFVTVTVSA